MKTAHQPTAKNITKEFLLRLPIGPALFVAGLFAGLLVLTLRTEDTGAGQLLMLCCGGILLALRRPSHEIIVGSLVLLTTVPLLSLISSYGELTNAFSIYAFIGLAFGVVAAILDAIRQQALHDRWLPRRQSEHFFKKFRKTLAKRKRNV